MKNHTDVLIIHTALCVGASQSAMMADTNWMFVSPLRRYAPEWRKRMSVFGAFDVSATGLTAQQLRMDTISENLANINTTRDGKGNVYKRKMVVFEEKAYPTFKETLGLAGQYIGKGVKVTRIVEDPSEGALVYDPSHPDANEDGYVMYPNVNTVTEMTNMIDATRAYEANVTMLNASKSMATRALSIGQ